MIEENERRRLYRNLWVEILSEPSNCVSVALGKENDILTYEGARHMAEWILDKTPERTPLDREGHMYKIADKVLSYIQDNPDCGYLEALCKTSSYKIVDNNPWRYAEYALCILRFPVSSKNKYEYTTEDIEYGQSLVDELPGWIRDRTLGIGGE